MASSLNPALGAGLTADDLNRPRLNTVEVYRVDQVTVPNYDNAAILAHASMIDADPVDGPVIADLEVEVVNPSTELDLFGRWYLRGGTWLFQHGIAGQRWGALIVPSSGDSYQLIHNTDDGSLHVPNRVRLPPVHDSRRAVIPAGSSAIMSMRVEFNLSTFVSSAANEMRCGTVSLEFHGWVGMPAGE